MGQYIEGFVTPVPKKNLKAYKKSIKKMGRFLMDNGAVAYAECVGDNVPQGKWTSFPKAVKLKPNEVVFFSWITFKSKGDRNRIMKKMMKDPMMMDPAMMPLDGKRMIFGSFKTFVSM